MEAKVRSQIKLKLRAGNLVETREIPPELVDRLGYAQVGFTTNASGFIACPGQAKDGRPLYMLGDSFVESIYCREGKRLPDVVDKELCLRLPGFSVYNGGMSGSSLLNMLNLFINVIIPNQKSVTLLFPGSISTACNLCENTFWNKIKDYSPLTDGDAPKKLIQPGDHYLNYHKLLQAFVSVASIFAMPLIICAPPFNHSISFRAFSELNEATRNFCKDSGCAWLDMDSWFGANTDLFYDKVHLNEQGALSYGQRLARELAEILRSERA